MSNTDDMDGFVEGMQEAFAKSMELMLRTVAELDHALMPLVRYIRDHYPERRPDGVVNPLPVCMMAVREMRQQDVAKILVHALKTSAMHHGKDLGARPDP